MNKEDPSNRTTFDALRAELEALRENNETFRLLLDESSDPIFMFRGDGTYHYVNRAFAEGVQKRQEEIIGKTIWDVFSQDEADKRYAVVKWVFENGQVKVIEVRVPRADGDRYYITTVKPVFDEENRVIYVICISKEITERKRMEDELRYLSTHDPLTGLYNRHFFQTEMERIEDSHLFPVGIVIADLDNLKVINDTQGHKTGDAIIIKAAVLLKSHFRSRDIVARIGGDEFAVLLTEASAAELAEIVCGINAELAKSRNELFSISLGWATAQESSSLSELMHQADIQMYREKTRRKEGKSGS